MRFGIRAGFFTHDRSGQSLVEVLVGMAIGIFLIVTGIGLIVPSMNTNTQVSNIQKGAALAKELLDNVRVWSEESWNNVFALATGTANHYYLNASSSPFASSSGSQAIVLSTTTYTRYFYVSDVYRDGSGSIITTGGGTYDPSTKEITAAYSWTGGSTTDTMSMYLTRNRNNIYDQTDWSGGSGASSAATSVGNRFATSSNIDYATTTGSIYINIPGY